MFEGRNLVIATMHQKQNAIAPILEKELGVNCILPTNFNSDLLGTFTGEIERKLDPLTTAKRKCELALENSDYDLAIASEGSFGNHPMLVFVPADEEILFFFDKKNNLEISVKELSTLTNFAGEKVKTENELFQFAKRALFPSHGLILRRKENDASDVVKGIIDEKELIEKFNLHLSKYGEVFVETDMRAMFNPTRMKVIEQATEKLVSKIKSKCPNCNTPGFSVKDIKKGLPCMLCHFPTNSILSEIYVCTNCQYKNEVKFPNGKTTEEPMYCDVCNP